MSWTEACHDRVAMDLGVHLEKTPEGHDLSRLVTDALQNYFAYRMRLNELKFKRLINQGCPNLLVGACFLSGCLGTTRHLHSGSPARSQNFLSKRLTIAGWVAVRWERSDE